MQNVMTLSNILTLGIVMSSFLQLPTHGVEDVKFNPLGKPGPPPLGLSIDRYITSKQFICRKVANYKKGKKKEAINKTIISIPHKTAIRKYECKDR